MEAATTAVIGWWGGSRNESLVEYSVSIWEEGLAGYGWLATFDVQCLHNCSR